MEKLIAVKVVPGAKVEQIQEGIDGSMKVWVKGQPKDGEANRALLKAIAKYFNVQQKNIKIVQGLTRRNKLIKISD